jgi:hypothetical protein
VTDSTSQVLASIDETLDGYVTWDGRSADAMRWTAGGEDVQGSRQRQSPFAGSCDLRRRLQAAPSCLPPLQSGWESETVAREWRGLPTQDTVKKAQKQAVTCDNRAIHPCSSSPVDSSMSRLCCVLFRRRQPVPQPWAWERLATPEEIAELTKNDLRRAA